MKDDLISRQAAKQALLNCGEIMFNPDKEIAAKALDSVPTAGPIPWKVFSHRDRELFSYTVKGESSDEEQETKEILAYDYGIPIDEIKVTIEERKRCSK